MSGTKQKMDRFLRNRGFGGLDDPNLIHQLAFVVKDHEQFRKCMAKVEPEKRRECYEAMRPHLNFEAKPLDHYMARTAELAEYRQLPAYYGIDDVRDYKVPKISLDQLATNAIRDKQIQDGKSLRLTCAKCTKVERFPATVRKDAERDAHKVGWRSNDKASWCPECVPSRLTMNVECECGKTHEIRAWDPQDGYASARVLGWSFEGSARCPLCNLKRIN